MYLDTSLISGCYEMPSSNLCWYIGFAQPYRSEHTLAGRVPGLGDRKLHRTGKMALLIKARFQHRSWLSSIRIGKVVLVFVK